MYSCFHNRMKYRTFDGMPEIDGIESALQDKAIGFDKEGHEVDLQSIAGAYIDLIDLSTQDDRKLTAKEHLERRNQIKARVETINGGQEAFAGWLAGTNVTFDGIALGEYYRVADGTEQPTLADVFNDVAVQLDIINETTRNPSLSLNQIVDVDFVKATSA